MRTGSGVAFDSSAGFRLPDGALLSPDASWVRRDRWQALTHQDRRGFAPLCPDVVFEIRSEGDALQDLRTKMLSYIANGAQLGVLVNPQDRALEIYRPGLDPERLGIPESVKLDPELPGFVLDMEPIFAE
jgi:Uma2 family endonuclease